MARKFDIVDLFAGPGGLGEGFAAAGREGADRMGIRLSVEMDDHAIQTLRLRSFLRSFDDGFPAEYYKALNAGSPLPDWSEMFPAKWKLVENEVKQLVLGQPGVFEEFAGILDKSREESHGDTILIGGPPCQAFSLVGRSRNMGKQDYVAENDHRHFLYKEYVNILNRLRPAAFVMENVKGMLSSKVDGGEIFGRILEDLSGAGDGYRLLPLSAPVIDDTFYPPGRDFIVRAEDHGVPQARHRVFILGIRRDIAKGLVFDQPLMAPRNNRELVQDALSGLGRVRSGLSRGDNTNSWIATVQSQAACIAAAAEVSDRIRSDALRISCLNNLPVARIDRNPAKLEKRLQQNLASWLLDADLETTLHHETRGHIPDDLGRYLFAAIFADEHNGRSPKLSEFPEFLQPNHRNRATGAFADRFRVQVAHKPSSTITSHISKDGHYYIHPDPSQCRALTVREAARLQTFPDNYYFCGPRTKQYHQVGNAVPPYLAYQIATAVRNLLTGT